MDSKVKDALVLFESAKTGWSSVYEDAKNDLKFYGGDQWEPKDIAGRMASKRPTITLNKLPQFVHQVVNDIRQNTPSLKALPMTDGADIETAKIIQGLLKNIEYTSRANQAYDTAAENQIKCSVGFLRVDHDFVSPDSFEQHCLIKRIVNPMAVMIDPNSVECDGSDAMFGFVNETLEMRVYEELYPGASKTDFLNPSSNKDLKAEIINIAEFFKIEQDELEIALLDDGSVILMETAQQLGLPIRSSRKIKKNKVLRMKMNGEEVLEETRFPGSYIPLVPVYGEEHWVDGKRNIYSLIRNAKDAQRMHNYWASLETEVISKAPQAPFMAAEGQLEGYENEWSNPALAQVLHYHSKDIDGNLVGAPQRLTPPTVPTGIVNARASTAQDMKEIMGIYDASLGQRSNERTGVAIQARQHEGDQGTMHFADNLNRSIEHVGRILLSMIPEIYDTQRIVRIINDEDDHSMIGINGQMTPGQERIYDLNVGKYDVAIKTGPSFATRRQEIQNMMSNVMQTNPALVQVMGDLFFKYSDMPGAEVIAARLKKTIPPQLLEGEDNPNGQQVPPQAQQAIQQMQAALQQDAQIIDASKQQMLQLAQELEACKKELADKKTEQQIKIQSDMAKMQLDKEKIINDRMKIEIEAQKAQTDQFKAHSDAELKAAELHLQAQQPLQSNNGVAGQAPSAPQAPPVSIVLNTEGKNQEEINMEVSKQMMIAHSIIDAVNNLTTAVTAPKQVIRDSEGRVAGVQ